MKITINPFDSKSVAAAIKQLEQYEKDFKAKETEFIRRLTEIGVSVASVGFETADYDGVNDVLVTSTQLGNRAAVIAYGETVGFIEFGTGVRNPEYNSSGLEYTPPKHGTYGKGHGANPHGWYYTPNEGVAGKHTYGNAPAEALLTARNTVIEKVSQIAREVWR